MKVFVVDSDAARTVTQMVHKLMFRPDECLSYDHLDTILSVTNELITAYLTNPPELESILSEFDMDIASIKDFVDAIDELFAETLQTVNLDILELSHTVVGDNRGMVLLMI